MNRRRAGTILGASLLVGLLWMAAALLRQRIIGDGPRCEIRGMALPVENSTPEAELKGAFSEIRALGFNTVLFKIAEWQEDFQASIIAPEPEKTLALGKLTRAIEFAKAGGLRVVLMPIVLLRTTRSRTEWRGMISPKSVKKWFHSYREMILKYAEIGSEQRVDFFSVGSELTSMEVYSDEWRGLIHDVRSRFQGKVFYSSNWDFLGHNPAWRDLDWLGLSAYFEMARPGETPTLEELNDRWRRLKPPIVKWMTEFNKPLFIVEAGYPSREGGLGDPWDHLKRAPVDHLVQQLGYRSLLESWAGFANLKGLIFYEWSGEGGLKDSGYTPRGKPAGVILQKWMQHL